jgi:hypothetical protein
MTASRLRRLPLARDPGGEKGEEKRVEGWSPRKGSAVPTALAEAQPQRSDPPSGDAARSRK